MNAGDGLRAGVLALGVSAATTLAGPVAASAAPPAALYVAPNGSSHGTCSRQTPCATITHAVAVAHAGDSVLVAPGTYRGQVTVSKRLTLRAEGPGVEIDATVNELGWRPTVTMDTALRRIFESYRTKVMEAQSLLESAGSAN